MSELATLQKAFTEHLRDPDNTPVPKGLDKRRMSVYSELIFSNLSALLSDFFPVIKSILSDAAWHQMVRNFFISHQSQTPYFMEIAGEFVEYLSQSQLISELPDFLTELAHYEWLELALFTMEEDPPESAIDPISLGSTPLSLSPLAQPFAYQFPVHQIRAGFLPSKPNDTPSLLMVARGLDESVRFYELQPLSFQLLHEMQQNPGLVPNEWLAAVANQIKVENKPEFISNGITLLQSFNEQKLFTSGQER